MRKEYRIHPTIGVARIGDSPDRYFVGPEAPGVPPALSEPDATPSLHATYKDGRERTTGTHWLAVGDAATACDPLSSGGICHALESGLRAAQVIEHRRPGDQTALEPYARWTRTHFDEFLRLRTMYYGRERRWPSAAFWQRRQGDGSLTPWRVHT